MASTNTEKKQALVDAMIDDHLHQLKKQQQAMATTNTIHNVPMEIVTVPTTTLPMAMDTFEVQDDDSD